MKSITLQQIAKLSGCTVSTVSRALHGSPRISQETREKIMLLAREKNYLPSSGTRVVAIIGFLAGFAPDHYMQNLLFLIAAELKKKRLRSITVFPHDLSLLNSLYISGAVSIMPYYRIARSWSAASPTPLVTINDYSERIGLVYSVCSDEVQTVAAVVEKLVARGCRHPGFFFSAEDTYCSKKRKDTYLKMMEQMGIRPQLFNGHAVPVLNEISRLKECDSFILASENLCCLAPQIHALLPDAVLAVWRFIQEEHPNEICVVQDYTKIAERAVGLIEKRIANVQDLHDELIQCKIYPERRLPLEEI